MRESEDRERKRRYLDVFLTVSTEKKAKHYKFPGVSLWKLKFLYRIEAGTEKHKVKTCCLLG